jgi:DNA-directed RNA polymerase specialized sigma24 family protein
MRIHFGKTEQPKSGARRDLRQERFTAYFPRLFAYACAATGNDEAARDVTVAAFSGVFSMPDMREAEFEVALFKAACELCSNGEYRVRRHNDGLTPREREVISLVFDGQLDQAKIAELLGVRADVVSMTLARGLRKLRTRLAPDPTTGAALPSFG